MQDVSCEPLMLQLPEKSLKQAWIFSVSHTITPPGSCIHRKAINKDKPSLSSGVLPSRQQSAMCSICPARIVLEDCHMQGKTVYSCL